MPIASLKLINVGPFDDIEFEFDRQVNVFTGPNNSGKSTVLWALGDILVSYFEFPRKLFREGKPAEFEVQLWGNSSKELSGHLPIVQSSDGGYWNEERWEQRVSFLNEVGYTNFIPALRRSTDFRSHGPTSGYRDTQSEAPSDIFLRALRSRRADRGQENLEQPPRNRLSTRAVLISDEEVIQQIIDLDYRSYRRNEPAFRDIIVKIGEMASEITEGFPIKFVGVAEDERGLFPQFHTPDGDVPLNVLSQGTQSIIQWLAHFLIGYAEHYDFPDNLEDKPGIFIVDEIDAHLHPSWQRRIIPTLTKHFPNLQIFCSTHSPLMLAGLKEGQAQLLRRDDQGKVTVSRNEGDIIGWSVDEITRILLDVPDPTDLETVKHLERLQELRRKQTLSAEETAELEKLRHTVNRNLLSGPRSAQVEEFAEMLRRARAESSSISESSVASVADAQIQREAGE